VNERWRTVLFISLSCGGIGLFLAAMLDYVAYEDFLVAVGWM
jgi:hypothetical protein